MFVENFDCTQFFTFHYYGEDDIKEILCRLFTDLPFKILEKHEIRQIKKEYFNQYIKSYLFELVNEEFAGDFEDWFEEKKVPQRIQEFSKVIDSLLAIEGISDFCFILTNFAEDRLTSTYFLSVNRQNIRKGLFYMSRHNYNILCDNLVVNVI